MRIPVYGLRAEAFGLDRLSRRRCHSLSSTLCSCPSPSSRDRVEGGVGKSAERRDADGRRSVRRSEEVLLEDSGCDRGMSRGVFCEDRTSAQQHSMRR